MTGLDIVRSKLVASLNRRFSNVISFSSRLFDCKYVVATLADPMTAFMVTHDERQLLAIVKDMVCYLILILMSLIQF